MKAGSLFWLVRHELRLWWRSLRGRGLGNRLLVTGTVLAVVVFTCAWFFLGNLRSELQQLALSGQLFWIAVTFWLLGFFYALFQAMQYSLTALFDRGDLDLLVSSPVASRTVFAGRFVGVVLPVLADFGLVVVPFSVLAVLVGFPQLLGIYPATLGIALVATSLAMLITLGLVRLFGAARARTFAQVFTVLLSALLFVLGQLPGFLLQTGLLGPRTVAFWSELFAQGSLLGIESPIWFPVRALYFEPFSVLSVLVAGGGLSLLTIEVLHRTFLAGTQQSVGRKRKQSSEKPVRFARNFNVLVLVKEWRMLWRNPDLLSRTFLSLLLVVPLLVLMRGGEGAVTNPMTVLTLGVVLIGSQVTMTLTNACISAEAAVELLKSSPIASRRMQALKLLAALLPVWVVFLPVFAFAIVGGPVWLPFGLFIGATTCTAVLRLWNARPVAEDNLLSKRENLPSADVVLGVLETVAAVFWACLAFGSGTGSGWWVGLPLSGVCVVVMVSYWRSRLVGTSLGY